MTDRRPQLLGSRAPHALPFFVAALALVFALSLASRIVQLRVYHASSAEFFSRGVPVAGTDSYLFFRYARDYASGADHSGRDPLRYFPDGYEYLHFSALAASMATVSRWTGLDLYQAGHWITIVTSSLFVLPLGIYLFRLGAPLAGIWGAVLGSFGMSYYLRTAVYRVDTDGGNLFFLWLVALLVLRIDPRRGLRSSAMAAALAGLSLSAFCTWYAQPGFAALFGGCTLLLLVARRSGLRQLLGLLAVFLVCANPTNLFHALADIREFVLRYLLDPGADPVAHVGKLRFPSVLTEIAELRRVSFLTGLEQAAGNAGVGALGLAGFASFALRRPVEMIPLLPLLLLALLGVSSAQRFLMYLGPLLGIGCGWLATLALRVVWARVPTLARLGPLASDSVATLVGVAPLVVLLPATTLWGIPQPRIRAELLASLQRMADGLTERAAIAHTWGHGYLVTDLTGAATFNDGGDPDPVVEQLIRRGLTDGDPAVLHDVVSFVAVRGRSGVDTRIEEHGAYARVLDSMAASDPPLDVPVYVLLTDEMLRGFGPTWEKGRWNFETNSGRREGYDVRRCEPEGELLRCSKAEKRDILIDPERGLVNDRPAIARFVRVAKGRVREDRSHPHPRGMWMQLLESSEGSAATLHILKRAVFESNFNQMFVLGRFDPSLFDLESDQFPVARLYRVSPTGR